jgi:riboflavin kinase/FMN adenylyltransferase
MLVTFEPHPQFFVEPQTAPSLLTTKNEKIEILRTMNLHSMCILPFTETLSKMRPQEFVENVLVKKIGIEEIVISQNHVFGRDRQGDMNCLLEQSHIHHFVVNIVPPVTLYNKRVSSSWIRERIKAGDVDEASVLLGRSYSFGGRVIRGCARGRTLQFPTANIQIDSERKLCPGDGVYAIWVRIKDDRHAGMMNIGRRPTFSHADQSIEVHIFDFHSDIYDQEIKIEMVKRIRDEQHFLKKEQLVAQIEEDRTRAKAVLSRRYIYSQV